MVAVGDAGLEGGGIPGAHHRFAILLDEDQFAFHHPNELVFGLMPVAVCRRGAGSETDEVDAILRQAAGIAEPLRGRPLTMSARLPG